MNDYATRYSAGRIIYNKRKETIVNNVFNMWIAYFGKPTRLLFFNGGEFDNEVYTEMVENLGINMTISPAESPFTNGVV